ncbi:MAG: glucokinase [Deltaproteobacteria bacterium]|nr:glucokinase [Deltaproteobacteria bacterium]
MGEQRLVIAGDMGGTKTLLGAYEDSAQGLRPVCEDRLINAGHEDAASLIAAFLKKNDIKGVRAACLAVACPVEENRGALTNLGWTVDGAALGERFNAGTFLLVNDLVATGLGALRLPKEDLHVLQEGVEKPGNRCLIAAGTGLGEAMLFWDGAAYHASPSEGGHADFASRSPLEAELLNRLSRAYGHVSYERILSGPGLEAAYGFLNTLHGGASAALNAAAIAGRALKGDDTGCMDALRLFVSIYGAEAGNLALKTLSSGGVYVGGGIAPKILPALESGVFMDAFRAKGRFEQWLSEVPVRVILNEKTAMLGAAHAAAGVLSRGRRAVKPSTGKEYGKFR